MNSNLRIFTSDVFRSSDHPSTSIVHGTESSPGKNHNLVLGRKHKEEPEGEVSRTIHRTFAFDEWDDEETVLYENDVSMETTAGSKSESSSNNLTKEIQEMVDALEDEIQRGIRRVLAFDEWDEKDTEFLAGNKNKEKRNQRATPNVNFVPIKNDENQSQVARNDKDTKLILTGATDATNPLKVLSLLSTPDTKFDLDTNLFAAITPSPISNNSSHIQRPSPLYTHQAVDRSNLYSTPTKTAILDENFQQQELSTCANNTNRYSSPKDYKSMELMFRQQQQEISEQFPPLCESIPRQVSAFHRVSPVMMGNLRPNTSYFSSPVEPSNGTYYSSSQRVENNVNGDGKWFDSYDINNTMFQEDQIFDSPTTTTSNDSTSSTIPKFITFYKNE